MMRIPNNQTIKVMAMMTEEMGMETETATAMEKMQVTKIVMVMDCQTKKTAVQVSQNTKMAKRTMTDAPNFPPETPRRMRKTPLSKQGNVRNVRVRLLTTHQPCGKETA